MSTRPAVPAAASAEPAVMEAKHTPAPWSAKADPYPDGVPYYRFTAGNSGYGDTDGGFSFTAIISDADAALIAAAPDLLALLAEAISEWDEFSDEKLQTAIDQHNTRLPLHRFKLALAARAAIARATGKSSAGAL